MTINIENEQIIPLREGPEHCPGTPHISAFYRWMNKKDSPLETIRVGGRRYTSVEAIHRFIERCTNPCAVTTVPLRRIAKREGRL